MKTRKLTTAAAVDRRDFIKLSLATGAAASFGVSAPAIAQQAKTVRFGHMMPTDSIYHRALVMFADEVGKLSSNKIKVDIFPASQLGSITEMMQSVQAGSLTMSMAVPAWYSNFIKPIDAFTLPYLVSSHEKVLPALRGQLGKEVEKMAETAGFKVFGYWLLGGRHIVNKLRPVNTPDDMKGMKIRVINSQVYMAAFRALGANPVAMDPSELYLALQQGVVDGFEYPLPDLLSFKLHEVAKFLSLDNHTTDIFLISTSTKTWAAMPAEEQAIINQAMKTAMDWQWKTQPVEIANALTRLRTLMTVNEISPANKELFIKQTAAVHTQFEPSIGKDFLALVTKELK
jgi:TRAP-type transport system periplasmic protein